MRLMDIGINLLNPSYDKDREEVVREAAAAGISPLILSPSGEEESKNAAIYAANYNRENPGSLYSKAGIHPHDAKNFSKNSMNFFRELIQGQLCENIVAIGECGLDYNRDFSPREAQRLCFSSQAELASELGLPLFMHERDSFEDFSAILKEHIGGLKASVVHCFTGNEVQLDFYLSLGCYIGITGWICDNKRGSHLRDLIKKIPKDRLMLESDGPYLLPKNMEKKPKNNRNEPKFLPHVLEIAAACLNKEPEILAEETYSNSLRFFGIVKP